MKLKTTSLLMAGALMGAAVMPAQASNEAMMDLLKVLHQRGTITDADYELLANAAKADKEESEAVANKVNQVETQVATKSAVIPKALEWAERVKIKGDMRFRQESIRAENTAGDQIDGEKENRLRIRARVGVYAQVNDNTDVGFRFVTTGKDGGLGSNDSTNESLDEDFKTRNLGIDLAYINWAPEMLGGNTQMTFGKMKQPWVNVDTLTWDGDTNPEGMAISSKFDFDGFSLVPSAGYYSLKDINNRSFDDEVHMSHYQLAALVGESKLGVSYFDYRDDTRAETFSDPQEERLMQVFAEAPIPGTPVTAYGSYVNNQNDEDYAGIDSDDDAWLIGAKAKFGKWKVGYEYRDQGVNALNNNFNNSDTLDNGKGSIFSVGYEIDKHFAIAATYYDMESNLSSSELGSGDIDELDTLHLDLKAKF